MNIRLCSLVKTGPDSYRCKVCGSIHETMIQVRCILPHELNQVASTAAILNTVNKSHQSSTCCHGEQGGTVTEKGLSMEPQRNPENWNEGWCFFVEDTSVRSHASATFVCVICRHVEHGIPHGIPSDKLARVCDKPIKSSEAETYDSLQKMPSIVKRLGMYGIEYLRHLQHGRPECCMQEILDRYAVCLTCSKHNKKDGVCMACGCFVNTVLAKDGLNKLSWKDTHCEDGRWIAIQ